MPTDTISLTISPLRRLTSVATLVAGGIGGRLSLPVDRIDDLQLAITTALGRSDPTGEATVELTVTGPLSVECVVGPVGDGIEATLGMLRRLVTEADLLTRESSSWVRLRLDLSSPAGGPAG